MIRFVAAVLIPLALAVAGCGGTEGSPVSGGSKPTTSRPTSTSAVPFDGEVLDTGEVAKVDKLDGVGLHRVDDGRVRSYNVSTEVLEIGTADEIDGGEGTRYRAGDGSTLLALRLRVRPFADNISDKVSASVSVDGIQRSLPDFEYALSRSGSGGDERTLQYMVGVPDERRSVELELKYSNLPQKFDLLEGNRTGDQPDILYRSPDAPSVRVEKLTPARLNVTSPKGEAGVYVVGVEEAELTYFAPKIGDAPSGKDKAWLVVTYKPVGEGSLDGNPDARGCVLPFPAFTIIDDSGGRYPTVDKYSHMEEFESEQTVVFEVPADLGHAVLTVAPQTFMCAFAGDEFKFTASGDAKVDMTLPNA